MLTWTYLPMELRLQIIEPLLQSKSLAPYASVSKEWQTIIEKETFRELKLRVSCLDAFERMIRRTHHRRALVRYIWLGIELLPYTCKSCKRAESDSRSSKNNALAGRAVFKLFSILANWGATDNGLTLELTAYSPSDSQHCFKDSYVGAHGEEELMKLRFKDSLRDASAFVHDLAHGWDEGQRFLSPSKPSIVRLYGLLQLRFPEELPEVKAVTKFVLRRQCRRRFVFDSFRQIFDKLPRLECLIYEPWQAWSESKSGNYDQEYQALFEAHLPKGLKRISIFEDYNDELMAAFEPQTAHLTERSRKATRAVGAALAHRSLDLEEIGSDSELYRRLGSATERRGSGTFDAEAAHHGDMELWKIWGLRLSLLSQTQSAVYRLVRYMGDDDVTPCNRNLGNGRIQTDKFGAFRGRELIFRLPHRVWILSSRRYPPVVLTSGGD
ncbi:hypothetical protein FZEAL_4622 [Fusarium zealandicum]|uniref:DUF6546 domain-containing protein n=1 Tax=Fusarium zealandicum TaxID=1053134 RepID=A0A8H4ULH3_9HYPO|nr:hypothetical protein FZEAL_4622 [Fusarium zealandicum]